VKTAAGYSRPKSSRADRQGGKVDTAEVNELLDQLGRSYRSVPDPRSDQARRYEALGCLQVWQRYPDMVRWLTDEVGPDELRRIGALSQRELGSKVNRAHLWGIAAAVGLGRGVAMGLGRITAQDRERDLADSLAFVRLLYSGLDGSEQVFGGSAAVLAPDWVQWLRGGIEAVEPGAEAQRRFAESVQRLAIALNFDNRRGRHDTGPYPTGDGEVLVVRDYFLADELHHWADVADGLPHSITQALLFRSAGDPLPVADNGLLREQPEPALVGVATYARDRWDTAPDQIRAVRAEERDQLARRCAEAADRLAARVAAMPRRDRVMAGAQAYYTDLIAPLARAAGRWERLRDEFDFFELDRLTSEVYYELIPGDAADELVPRLVASGAAFAPVRAPISDEEAMPALHLLAIRGTSAQLPVEPAELEGAGLVTAGPAGYQLTEAGRAVHERLLAAERKTYEPERLEQAYQRFVALDGRFLELTEQWDGAGPDGRAELLAELADILQRARVALRRTNEQLLRFEPYLPRLRRALGRAQGGEPDYVADPSVESVRTVWIELHRDYQLTQGLPRT
jgi:hypothetical protein